MTSRSISPDQVVSNNKSGRFAYTALRGVLTLAFIGAGIFKLSGHPAAIAEFDDVGFGQWLRYVTAATEITGAVLLILPRTIKFGAALLATLCVAAFFAQRFALHGDIVHTIVLAAILGTIALREQQRRSSRR